MVSSYQLGTGGAISRVGLTPVYCDIAPATYNICPTHAAELAEQCSDLFHDSVGLGDAVTLMVDRSFGQTWVLTGYKDHLSTANSLTEWGW